MTAARDDPDVAVAPERRVPAGWLPANFGDRTRARVATLNQLLLGSVVFVLGAILALGPTVGDLAMFFVGVFIVFAVTGATFVVPWNRLPLAWLAVVPALDVVAITVMQVAAPTTVAGILWIFPTTWLAGGFGLIGLLSVLVSLLAINAVVIATSGEMLTYATVLVPVVLLAVATTSYLSARRSEAQRNLLAKQAVLLRRVLERTRQQEQEVTEVLDAVDFGVIRISADGRVAITNEAHGRLQQALRTNRADPDSPAFRDDAVTPLPAAELPLERALRGEAFDGQVVWFGAESEPRQALSVSARRLTDPGGRDVGAVVVSRDVTAELSALRARDELVASVSHELRTPLTAILGYLDLAMEDPGVTEAARANLDIAERNAERLLGIVADILAASSSSRSAQVSLEPRSIDAREVVLAAVEAMIPRADGRGISVDVSGLEEARVWADPLRLRQVVDNLLANAITYNHEGGTVFMRTGTDGSSSWISVRDTGPGVSAADRAQLFQRFYKAGRTRRSGTGLGLAISRDIVRGHGGELTLEASAGPGSTFVVVLPADGRERTAP